MLLLVPLLLSACEFVPSSVEQVDIDDAMALGRVRTVCRGLEMRDDPDTRRYAASRLADVEDPKAVACVCEAVWDEQKGAWDEAVLKGLAGSGRDDMVRCVLQALSDPRAQERERLVVLLADTEAPVARAALRDLLARQDAAPEVRARAAAALAGTSDATEVAALLRALTEAGDAAVRAASADALAGRKEQEIVAALQKAATDDPDPAVRAAAVRAFRRTALPEADTLACTAMMEDPSPEVRRTAILTYKGTRRAEPFGCLRRRALTREDDGSVREALLRVLKSSPRKEAADVLCDAIPFWVRTYVDKEHPDRMVGANIIEAQNDRDWERSYACVQRALSRIGGATCKGRQYTAAWFRELGGSAYVPRCPGDPPAESE